MMDSATETIANRKRVRIAPEPSKTRQIPQAIEMAKLAASVTLASLPPAIKTLAMRYHSVFLNLRIDLRNLENTQSRLAKDDFIPRSARFDFTLNATDRVKEHASAEYKTLLEQTDLELILFQRTVKRLIVRQLDLEIKTTKKILTEHFCTSIVSLANAVAIHHPTVPNNASSELIHHVFEQHHQTLLVFSEIPPENPQEFFTPLHDACPLPGGVHEIASLGPEAIARVMPLEEPLKALLDALFCRSWQAYLDSKETTVRQLALQDFVESEIKERATAAVAMDIDSLTADSAEVGMVIKEQVANATKNLQKQVSRLQNQLNVKNKSPGAAKSRARSTKKKDTSQARPAARKAADAVKEPASAKKKAPRGRGNKPKQKSNKK
jgi:hypothetical protein